MTLFILYIISDFIKWIIWIYFLKKLMERELRHATNTYDAKLMLLHLDNEKIMEAINEKCICRNCKDNN